MGLAMTREQFEVLIDQESSYRYEFIDGVAYNMTGSTRAHADICMNVAFALRSQLGGTCRVYTEQYVCVPDRPSVIPDVVVTCHLPGLGVDRRKTFKIDTPLIVVEVLSESTMGYDRTEKFERYRLCPTLAVYVLISQNKQQVEVYRRDRNWERDVFGVGAIVDLGQLELALSVSDVYDGVF